MLIILHIVLLRKHVIYFIIFQYHLVCWLCLPLCFYLQDSQLNSVRSELSDAQGRLSEHQKQMEELKQNVQMLKDQNSLLKASKGRRFYYILEYMY